MNLRVLLTGWLLACNGGGGNSEICFNEVDDDDNGLVDCADRACADPLCPEVCDDGRDNNLDERIDCDDPTCAGSGCPEICDDGLENDADGAFDCDDTDCAGVCDADGDGFANEAMGGDDCDDDNPAAWPGAREVCDGADNDCNGDVDQDDAGLDATTMTDWFRDTDGDGYGMNSQIETACDQPPDTAATGGDCVDDDPARNPGATEICNELDDNCDGWPDDLDPYVDLTTGTTFWIDADGDGYGDANLPDVFCRMPPGYCATGDDCDDTDAAVLGASMWVLDTDGDGYGSGVAVGPLGCTAPGADYVPENWPVDCNEADAAVYPGAYEVCGDLVDSSCDGNDCPQWSDDFEAGPLGALWVTGGNQPWFVQGNTVYAGLMATESGNIGNYDTSTLGVTLDFPIGGNISFWHSGDTEFYFDFLRFYVDGIQLESRSGLWGWTYSSYPVPPGVHQLEWHYTKDGSVSTVVDAVFLDDVFADGGVP